jgi:RimJ/RimL family protein N-acetyltransferase
VPDDPFATIETERLRLRRFRADDAAAFAAYRADPDVARFQGWEAGYPLDAAERFVKEMAAARPGVPGGWFQIAIADRDTDDLLGDCVVHVLAADPTKAEVGYTMAPGHQGRGYATEAVRALVAHVFGTLDVTTVRAVTDARNTPSIRLAERLGMEHVDTAHATFKGEPCVEYTYELTRT